MFYPQLDLLAGVDFSFEPISRRLSLWIFSKPSFQAVIRVRRFLNSNSLMNMKLLKKNDLLGVNLFLTSVLLLTLSVSQSFPQKTTDDFYCNPLLLNGKMMDAGQLSAVTQGRLTMVKGEPSASNGKRVAFFIYLRRGGQIVDARAPGHISEVTEIELFTILKSARVGDQLVIEPADQKDKSARRTLTVQQTQLLPQIPWLLGVVKNGTGC
jgi:hypothetical protein